MNELSKQKLMNYIENANKHDSHLLDNDRFVEFIKTSHSVKDDMVDTSVELYNMLKDYNFPDYKVDSLISAYEFSRRALMWGGLDRKYRDYFTWWFWRD